VRLIDIREGVNQFVSLQIENFDCRIFLGSQKEPVAREVDGKMIKIAVMERWQWNRLHELEWTLLLTPSKHYGRKQQSTHTH
jgi:hypothetical protein